MTMDPNRDEQKTIELIYKILPIFFEKKEIPVWLGTPNSYLQGRTPQSLIDEGRADIVLEPLLDILHGRFS